MEQLHSDYLRSIILKLSRGRRVQDIIDVVRSAARSLTQSDGASFILKDQDKCYYVDEDAIGPLWKGKKFPLEACVSGWVMVNKKSAIIKDIYQDPRVPVDVYKATFVKSMVMVPINVSSPFGVIGNYWSVEHECTKNELKVLTLLAEITSVALQNVEMLDQLENLLTSSNSDYRAKDDLMVIVSEELNLCRKGEGHAMPNFDGFSDLVSELRKIRNNESQLKKVIFEISVKQLNEMNRLMGEYLKVQVL